MDLFDYDAELRLHNAHFFAAAKVGAGDRVLDIGCGTGQTTREAARATVGGSAVGVDISEVMLAQARRISDAEGPSNVSFELADAQVNAFPSTAFDLCISRFGVMFFADPVTAFTNIARALRPGGRLVWLVWQGLERNEWASVFRDVLGAMNAMAGPGPFSLADPAGTESMLATAGFTDISFTEIDEPVYYGSDSAAAYGNLLRLTGFTAYFDNLELAEAGRARAQLHEILADHQTTDGVYFDSRAWLITARRP